MDTPYAVLPSAPARRSGLLLVIGSAEGGVEDARKFLEGRAAAGLAVEVMAVNGAIARTPMSLDHAASLHTAELLGDWLPARRECGLEVRPLVHAPRLTPGVDHCWKFQRAAVGSGLFAAWIGLAMGFGRVVLAGVTIDPAVAHAEGAATDYLLEHQPAWTKAAGRDFGGRVRALTPGWLQGLLGKPDKAWLREGA